MELRRLALVRQIHRSGVALLLELLGEGDLPGIQSEKPVRLPLGVDPHVEPGALRIRPSKKGRTRRRANRIIQN